MGLPDGVRGLAGDFATSVPNCGNGGFLRFLRGLGWEVLVSIAKHWGFSL
jgi:hypothetical protein